MTAVFIFDYTNGLGMKVPCLLFSCTTGQILRSVRLASFTIMSLQRSLCSKTSNAGISISCRRRFDGCELAHDFEVRRLREILDALERRYDCVLPPRVTRSKRTTRCRNSIIRKATSNDNSHRSCALHCTVTTGFSVMIAGQGAVIDVSGK